MLNLLRLARPVVEVALECVLESPAGSGADLRHLEAMSGILKEDANALVVMLIARDSGENMVAQAEE